MQWHAYQYLRRLILVAELRIDAIRAYIRDEEGIMKWAIKETEETKFKREMRIKQLKRNEARYMKFLERKYVVLDGQMRLRGFRPNGAGCVPLKDFA